MRHPVEVDGQLGAERGEERCCQCEHDDAHRHAEAAEQAPGIESAAPPDGICRCLCDDFKLLLVC